MATFHRMTDEQGKDVVRCFVKGAPDQLLARAADVRRRRPRARCRSTTTAGERYLAENQRLGEQGLRVLATGRKDFDPATFDPNADLLPLLDGLTLLALVGIVDPPRPEAKAAIATAKAAGIQVRMITGDHAVTAKAIGDQLGIEGRAVTGAEFAAMSDDELVDAIDGIGVIARVAPRGQGPPRRHPEAQGPHRRHDRRRRERRAGAQEGRHRHRHGHHRHRGVEGSGGDDPHRRQLLHDREGGRDRPRPSTTT